MGAFLSSSIKKYQADRKIYTNKIILYKKLRNMFFIENFFVPKTAA